MCRAGGGALGQAARLAGEARALVSADRRDFFQAHILTQLDVHRHSNRMLRHIAEAAAPGASAAKQLVNIEAAVLKCGRPSRRCARPNTVSGPGSILWAIGSSTSHLLCNSPKPVSRNCAASRFRPVNRLRSPGPNASARRHQPRLHQNQGISKGPESPVLHQRKPGLTPFPPLRKRLSVPVFASATSAIILCMPHKVTLIPGDGIGPEVAVAATRAIDATGVDIAWERVELTADIIAAYREELPHTWSNPSSARAWD